MAVERKSILTVKNIRNVNVGNILQSVLKSKTTTRSVLAKENKISLMTVKHIVDDLIEKDVLIEKESKSTEVGRNPKVLELSELYGNIVCMNLTSKDEISFLIYDIYKTLIYEEHISFEEGRTYIESLENTVGILKEKLKAVPTKLVGVAVFVPSAYNESVDLVNYDLIPEFKELHIKAFFEKELQITNILILHDVFAAAWSEYDSLNPEKESQFYFYCGYGVGGYFIHKNEPVSGEENMAGEVGKMLMPSGESRRKWVTLEEIVSISAVKKKMELYGKKHFRDLLREYREGDKAARKILEPVLETISLALYNLLWIYNPTGIVVDSCREGYSDLIIEHFQRFLDEMKDDAIPIHVRARKAKYDEYHTMRGCFHMTRSAWIEEIADS